MDIFAIINDIINEIFDLCMVEPGIISVSKSHIYYMNTVMLPYQIKGNDIFKIVEDVGCDIDTGELIYDYIPVLLGKIQISKKEFKKLLIDAMMRRYVWEEYGEEL